MPENLFTQDRTIDLAPASYVNDLPRLRQRFASASGPSDLLLIGRRHLRSNNSWMHNSERLTKGKTRCTLLIHPEDAKSRGLHTGDEVSVVSRIGQVCAPLEVSEEMMPGVVSLPHGWGHHRPGTKLSVASRKAGVSMNDLTDEQLVDQMSGNSCLNGIPVQIQKASTRGGS